MPCSYHLPNDSQRCVPFLSRIYCLPSSSELRSSVGTLPASGLSLHSCSGRSSRRFDDQQKRAVPQPRRRSCPGGPRHQELLGGPNKRREMLHAINAIISHCLG
ncbi:hypothetical protein HU200_027117 [Digitaria exilis]|uniref:Uncharacterized protein n=1 Tax=Digitaria exilis TaxID=1010633 RepID=A0A835C657_9POAL|nr:hypothetical protein HU200_027117 [Digitaria exilis]